MADRSAPASRSTGRGPHPLALLLAIAARETMADPAGLTRFLHGLERYQRAPAPPAMPPLRPVARIGRVTLRRADSPRSSAKPTPTTPAIILVPSLINAPDVLDLAPRRSLLRYLAGRGHDVHLIDWGDGFGGERRLGLAGMVSARLLPLIRRLGRPAILIGYCLGGTLALAAARLLGPTCHGLVMLAAPWHADGYAPDARARAAAHWQAIRPLGRALGAVPISILNPMFWALDEAAVVGKYQHLADRPPHDPAIGWFAAVEDWANSGAPLSLPAARDLFDHGFARDRIGRGRWRVAGTAIRPEDLACPILDAGALADRIVPQAARLRRAGIDRLDIASGHVGMIIGGSAEARLWQPLSNWLQGR